MRNGFHSENLRRADQRSKLPAKRLKYEIVPIDRTETAYFDYSGMAQDIQTLFERANYAVLEATRLIEVNLDWQCRVYTTLRRMRPRAIFEGDTRRPTYPQDIQERRWPYERWPSEDAPRREPLIEAA